VTRGGEDVGTMVVVNGGARWRWEWLEVELLMFPCLSIDAVMGLRESEGEFHLCFLSAMNYGMNLLIFGLYLDAWINQNNIFTNYN